MNVEMVNIFNFLFWIDLLLKIEIKYCLKSKWIMVSYFSFLNELERYPVSFSPIQFPLFH